MHLFRKVEKKNCREFSHLKLPKISLGPWIECLKLCEMYYRKILIKFQK